MAQALAQFGQPLADPQAVGVSQVAQPVGQFFGKVVRAGRTPAQQGADGHVIEVGEFDKPRKGRQDGSALEAADRLHIDAEVFGNQFLSVTGCKPRAGECFAELFGEVLICGQGCRVNMTCCWSTRMLAGPGSLRNNVICWVSTHCVD